MCGDEFSKDCIGEYNSQIMDPLEPYTRMSIKILIVIGALLDLACFKWLSLANLFFYLECITRLVALLMPNFASYEYTPTQYVLLFALYYCCLYCDSVRQTIFSTITLVIHFFFDLYAYKRDITAGQVLVLLIFTMIYLIGCTGLSSVIVHMSNVHAKLYYINEENTKLLNGMHEGILIVSKKAAGIAAGS